MITNLKVLEYLDIISPVNSQTVEEFFSIFIIFNYIKRKEKRQYVSLF